MSGHSRKESARRAGVDLDYVDQLVELGILRPGNDNALSQGDVRRARWVHSLEAAGVPLEGMAAAVRDGKLSFSYLDASAFDRFAGLSSTTFEQLSARTGIALDLLKVVREAFGLAEPDPQDLVREDELSVVELIELLVSKGFRQDVIERLLRVCADSLGRIVETETDAWQTEVESPLLEGGMSAVEMLDAQADLGNLITPLFEQALMALYRGQQEHAWHKNAVENVEELLEKAGLHNRLHHPPAVCFLDITGYTATTEELGDEAAADLAGKLAVVVRRFSLERGGQAVKWLGDGAMFYFPDPGRGVLAALDMVDGLAGEGLPPAHVGIHAGPVVFQGGDYFGRTVNIASRIAGYARPSEVLVSQAVVDAAEGSPVEFTEIGPVELKGVSGTLRVHSAHRA